MMQARRYNPTAHTDRRRGSIYAVVLAMAILVSLIGLSAVAVGRINLRTAAAGGDSSSAELLALSAIEHGIAVLNSDSNWRSNYANDVECAPIALGPGSFTWKLRDEIDGDLRLSVGGLQPARIVGIGRVGDARRAYSVALVPSGANKLTNPGIESGTTPYEASNCVIEQNATNPHGGLRSMLVRGRADRTGGPAQDLKGVLTSGRSYYIEAWVRMSTSAEQPVISIVVTDGGILGILSSTTVFKAKADSVGVDWTKVSVALNPSWTGSPNNIYWHIETNSTNQDFYIDDVKVIEGTSMGAVRETWKQESLQ